MTEGKVIVPLIPHDLPKADGVPSPITAEHTPIECPRCNGKCWISPALNKALQEFDVSALCWSCIARAGLAKVPQPAPRTDAP